MLRNFFELCLFTLLLFLTAEVFMEHKNVERLSATTGSLITRVNEMDEKLARQDREIGSVVRDIASMGIYDRRMK